jgi:hypothetical protein
MDWASIAPAAITGVVGLGGIGASLWQAKKGREAASADLKESLDASTASLISSIDAENKRVREAEKRRLYAASLAAFNEMISALIEHSTSSRESGRQEGPLSRTARAQESMNRTLEELMLIAPQDVGVLAVDLSNFFVEFIRTAGPNDRPNAKLAGQMRTGLVRAMRDDLGERNWGPERQQPRDTAQ